LPQGVAHQAARHVFLVGVKKRLMPRELAASVLQDLRNQELEWFTMKYAANKINDTIVM
jgi:hypothetical protein